MVTVTLIARFRTGPFDFESLPRERLQFLYELRLACRSAGSRVAPYCVNEIWCIVFRKELVPIVNVLTHGSGADKPVGLVKQVCACTGPGPVPGFHAKPGAHWIQFDVAKGGEQVRLVHYERVKSLLPKVSAPIMSSVGL